MSWYVFLLMRVLLLIPPMTQLNTPYPATAYLTGFLRSRGRDVTQADPAIELVCRLFSERGLSRIHEELCGTDMSTLPSVLSYFLENFHRYKTAVDAAVRFLQGRDASLASRIASRKFLPEGPVFQRAISSLENNDYLDFAFGTIGVQDRAKYFASLFI